MNFKIYEFVKNPKIIPIYAYTVCDQNGNDIRYPTYDFLNELNKKLPVDAQILKSQINQTANTYGINGRDERSSGREGLFAIPSKYEEGINVYSRSRLFYWKLNENAILLGGGCNKPHKLNGQIIKQYQKIESCENAASELCIVAQFLESHYKKNGISINEITNNEILPYEDF